MKKIISIFACVCLLLSAMVIPVSAADSVTYTFSNYKENVAVTDYTKALDDTITIGLYGTSGQGSGNFHDQLRVYQGAYCTISSTKNIASITFNLGYKNGTYDIETSTDGSTWNLLINDAAYTTAYADHTITLTTPVKYIKYTGTAQTRIKTMTVTFAKESGEATCTHDATTTTSNGDETHSVVCDSCGEVISTADCKDIDLDAACDTCAGEVALPETLTIAEAVALGAEQADSAYTTDKYFVTGQITAIANATYGNVYIADEAGNEIYVYGLYSNDGTVRYDAMESKPDEGDIVKVLSVVGNYKGTAQLKNAWLIEFEAGELAPTTPDPDADTTLTIEEAIALGESKKSSVYTENKYYVTGTITEIYEETYGNMYIADENGNTLTIYGSYNEDGTVAYKDMETKPVAGDTITVYGIIGNYNGAAQMKNGWVTIAEKEPALGSYENPYEVVVSEGRPLTVTTVTVPAGEAVYIKPADVFGTFIVLQADGNYNLINGAGNQAVGDPEADYYAELNLVGLDFVVINNAGETDITAYVALVAGVAETTGTWDNPEVLELMENPWNPMLPPSAEAQTALEAGNQGYFYKIVAEADGAFVVNIAANDDEWNNVGYQYSVTNNTTSWQSDFIVRGPEADDFYDALFVEVKAGDEILINAGTYNPDDRWNAPAGTLNVSISFTTVGASDYPEIITATGDYTSTLAEGSQGYYYEYVVEQEGTITVAMNSDSYQYQVNVIPADEEDYGSYVYGDLYNSDDAVASDSVNVNVGDTVTIMVNTYDAENPWTAPAGTVSWTLSWSEKVEEPVVTGVFSIADATATVGEEFTVTIDVANNPGIIGATLNINYDADILELVKAEGADFTNETTDMLEAVYSTYNFGPIQNNPFKITWVDALASENVVVNGAFATLTFKVKDAATAGTTDVSITIADVDDIFDIDLNNVAFETDGATITINEKEPEVVVKYGDVDGNGKIAGKDYSLLMQYLNGWDVTINEANADVDGNGKIAGKDYSILMQYLNGWDVVLGPKE